MNDALIVCGYAIMIVFTWLGGLVYSPFFMEKLFPKWSIVRQAYLGVLIYMFLTGIILVIVGKLL